MCMFPSYVVVEVTAYFTYDVLVGSATILPGVLKILKEISPELINNYSNLGIIIII